MSRDAARLAELARLAALIADRSLAPVAAAQARRAEIRDRIAQLAARRASLGRDGVEPHLAAALARQAEALRRAQAEALSELARQEAALEIAKAEARPAFGRKLALERLLTERKG